MKKLIRSGRWSQAQVCMRKRQGWMNAVGGQQ